MCKIPHYGIKVCLDSTKYTTRAYILNVVILLWVHAPLYLSIVQYLSMLLMLVVMDV